MWGYYQFAMTIPATTIKIQYIPCIINKQLNDHLGKLHTEMNTREHLKNFMVNNKTTGSKIKKLTLMQQ